jgi:hypothetical protein
MLIDHGIQGNRAARATARQRQTVRDYGDYIVGLADWKWFITITFRHEPGLSESALSQVETWFNQVRGAVNGPIGYVMVYARGALGSRGHVHALIAGVDQLDIRAWRNRANRQFGDCKIEPYDSSRGAAYYVAENGLSTSGDLRFGGELLLSAPSAVSSSDVDRIVKGQFPADIDHEFEDDDAESSGRSERKYVEIFIAGTSPKAPVQGFAWYDGETEHVKAVNGSSEVILCYRAMLSTLRRLSRGYIVTIRSHQSQFTHHFEGRGKPENQSSEGRLLQSIQKLIKRNQLEVQVIGCLPEGNFARKLLRTLTDPAPRSKPKRRRVGRPRRTDLNPVLIGALRRRGISLRKIAKGQNAGYGTIRRIYATWLAQHPEG